METVSLKKNSIIHGKYDLYDFEPFSYTGVLSNPRWEKVAAVIIHKSIEAGSWKRIKEFSPDFDIDGMEIAGFIKKDEKGYMLTSVALEKMKEEIYSMK